MTKVAILVGVFSGPRTLAHLRVALERAGYQCTKDVSGADVIITHSGACFWLDQTRSDQLLILINPIYWPGKTPWQRGRKRLRNDMKFQRYGYSFSAWLQRHLWGIYYTLRYLPQTVHIFRIVKDYDLRKTIRGRRVVLIRNEHDDWCTPNLEPLRQINPTLRIVAMPNDHEDVTYHPDNYVKLLQSEL